MIVQRVLESLIKEEQKMAAVSQGNFPVVPPALIEYFNFHRGRVSGLQTALALVEAYDDGERGIGRSEYHSGVVEL